MPRLRLLQGRRGHQGRGIKQNKPKPKAPAGESSGGFCNAIQIQAGSFMKNFGEKRKNNPFQTETILLE